MDITFGSPIPSSASFYQPLSVFFTDGTVVPSVIPGASFVLPPTALFGAISGDAIFMRRVGEDDDSFEESLTLFSPLVVDGAISGVPVFMGDPWDTSVGQRYFSPVVGFFEQEVELDQWGDALQFYEPRLSEHVVDFSVVFNEHDMYEPMIARDLIDVSFFDTSFVSLLPLISGNVIEFDEFFESGGVFFDPLVYYSISTELLDSGGVFFQPRIAGSSEIELEFSSMVNQGSVFEEPLVAPGEVEMVFSFSQFSQQTFVFPPVLFGEVNSPLRFKAAESPLGGDITTNNVFSSLNYIPVDSASEYLDIGDFSYSFANNLIDNYISSSSALFSQTYYRGFYVRNDSNFDHRRNIKFWVDGGLTYRLSTASVDRTESEAYHIYDVEKDLYGAEFTQEEENAILLGGQQRTSLFGQMKVSYLVSNTRILYPFDESGVGLGVNLPSEKFIPGNQISDLPDLAPGEFIGVYLKVETKFSPDFPIKRDYSFFHLAYSGGDEDGELYERYPGQVRFDGELVGLMLPSISMRVSTDYDGLLRYLNEDVERLYNRYPPFFTNLEDSKE